MFTSRRRRHTRRTACFNHTAARLRTSLHVSAAWRTLLADGCPGRRRGMRDFCELIECLTGLTPVQEGDLLLMLLLLLLLLLLQLRWLVA